MPWCTSPGSPLYRLLAAICGKQKGLDKRYTQHIVNRIGQGTGVTERLLTNVGTCCL